MKSRRVLQIIVAVLSIITLVCLALVSVTLVGAKHLDVTPQEVVDFTATFNDGIQSVADKFSLPKIAVSAVAVCAPAVLLLLAIILITAKNKGKDTKNIVGCVFALAGAAILMAFLMVFAKHLFAENLLTVAFGASGGLLALFIIFVGAALGVKPKRIVIADESETAEESAEAPAAEESAPVAESEEEPAEDVVEVEESEEPVEIEEEHFDTTEESLLEDDAEDVEELKKLDSELAILEKVLDEKLERTEPLEESAEETPATQYVPQQDVSIHDVVERTYGKDGDGLTKSTIEKINKVRALYELRAITEEEYLKLVRKYLGL